MAYPAHYELARSEIGIREVKGSRDNQAIVNMFADVGHSWVKNDETAWCAAALGSWLERNGIRSTRKLNARSYLNWGDPMSLQEAKVGDVCVFWRESRDSWQGHVGFYVRHDANYIWTLGGNQDDQISVAAYKRSRFLGIRRWSGVTDHKAVALDPTAITLRLLDRVVSKHAPRSRVEAMVPLLNEYLPLYNVNNPKRIALFLANILAETGGFEIMEENLNYSAQRMTEVWPSRFPTTWSARPYARNPEALANNVYNRYSNKGIPGAGWKYRGRGFMQTTFLDNYRLVKENSGLDVVNHPDLLLQNEPALIAALVFWHAKGLNAYADASRVTAARKVINGGTHGLTKTKNYYHKLLPLLKTVRYEAEEDRPYITLPKVNLPKFEELAKDIKEKVTKKAVGVGLFTMISLFFIERWQMVIDWKDSVIAQIMYKWGKFIDLLAIFGLDLF